MRRVSITIFKIKVKSTRIISPIMIIQYSQVAIIPIKKNIITLEKMNSV